MEALARTGSVCQGCSSEANTDESYPPQCVDPSLARTITVMNMPPEGMFGTASGTRMTALTATMSSS